jgi:O-antigen ligase/tetratricopeptide (TPR) repeat protein
VTSADQIAGAPAGWMTARQWALAIALVYFVLVGGTNIGTYVIPFTILNTVLATGLVALWVMELPRNNDLTDRILVVALLAFLVACLTSAFPRMSFDAATSAIAFLAAFGIARGEVTSRRAERAMITALAACGCVLAIGLLNLWIPYWVEWWQTTSTAPPLDVRLPAGPYRAVHHVALLLALLLPALLQTSRRRLLGLLAILAAIATLAVIYMTGRRTVWLALLAVAAGAAALRLHINRRLVTGGLLVTAGGVVGLTVVGAMDAIAGRLLNTFTLAIRAETWLTALGLWLERPLNGWGPGSFAATFSYGETFPVYPDPGGHAHNVAVQALLEGGLLGLAALTLLVAGLAMGIWRNQHRSGYALAGFALFGLMSLTDLPSNFPMILVVGMCWAALAAPRASGTATQTVPRPRRPLALAASATVGAVIVVAVASTLVARAAFDDARAQLEDRDLAGAREALDRAVAFDPSMALYWRERGTRAAEDGDFGSARSDLERALELNAADATTLRALAAIATNDGRSEDAVALARRAVDLQGVHISNQLLLAWVATRAGDEDLATRALADALIWNPWTTAAPTWIERFGSTVDTPLREATATWGTQPADRQRGWEATWLRAMTDAEPFVDLGAPLAALDAVIRCDTTRASGLLADAGTAANDHAALTVRLMLARLGEDDDAFREAATLAFLKRDELAALATRNPRAASPFSDHGMDVGMYKRIPLPVTELEPMLPTSAEGMAAWLQDPIGGAQRGAPESGLATCEP